MAIPIPIDQLDDRARARFWSHVRRTEGCWAWTAAKAGGYGRFKIGGRLYGAHRISVVLASGVDIPTGLWVDHLCRNRACVRPDHLECVPPAVNTGRGNAPNILWKRRRQEERICPRGHDLDEHGYVVPSGKGMCRECDRNRRADPDFRAKNRARAREARRQGRWKG